MHTTTRQAAAQLSSIRAMLAALNCDYERLQKLRDIRDELDTPDTQSGLATWDASSEGDELRDMEEAAGNCEDQEEALERIYEDPLSVQVQSGWHNPGEKSQLEEFEILLCTGGPAVRIMGDLNEHNEPCRAYMQYQDWGTPWTDYYEEGCGDVCLEYAQVFYFGE